MRWCRACDWVDANFVGLYEAIGIRKGPPFAPDARMKKILTDSVAVANAIARSELFASRDPRTRIFHDRQWATPFVGGSYKFLAGAERLLDARTFFFYYATGITPAMSEAKPGTGSAYAVTLRDAAGNYLDGGRSYTLTLPAPIPAKNFWALTVYDNQTRSLLPTDQKLAGADSTLPAIQKNPVTAAPACGLVLRRPPAMKRTGYTPCLAGVTTSFCGSMGRRNPGSTRLGNLAISNCSSPEFIWRAGVHQGGPPNRLQRFRKSSPQGTATAPRATRGEAGCQTL